MPVVDGIFWERHGDPEGRTLILSAGLGGMGDYWRPNIDALAQQHCVYVYDHRGTGRSDRNLPERVTIDGLADDIALLVDRLSLERPVVIGHAAGAAAAMALALRAPESISGQILVNAWSHPNQHFIRCIEVRLAVLAQGGPQAYFRAQPVFLFPANWVSDRHEALEKQLHEQIETFQGDANLRRRAHALMTFDIDDRLRELNSKTLLIVAEDDMLVPSRCSDRLAQGIGGAELASIRLGGHACNVTHPDQFNKIVLDWLSKNNI